MKHTLPIIALLLALGLSACNKDEGVGGSATIQGRIYKVIHSDDNYDLSLDTIVAAKQDVFIVYGSEGYVGDDVETGEDGSYRFRYLTAGNYTVYAYSELASGEKVAVSQTVSVDRGSTTTVPDIYIHTGKANGTSMVKGWVRATYFNKNGVSLNTDWAYGQRVYIQRLGEPYYFDDTRVGLNGLFYFQKLQPDTYIVFTFGEDPTNTTNMESPVPVSDTITVSKTDTVYTIHNAIMSIYLKS
ncbi:MAG: carboxypeptidase regulatory-like domain-containing protein [Bacteroidales bacterium]|nr:carboxypeptidase regulatory-like domain-containing protein [Bacteroidales bacterium]